MQEYAPRKRARMYLPTSTPLAHGPNTESHRASMDTPMANGSCLASSDDGESELGRSVHLHQHCLGDIGHRFLDGLIRGASFYPTLTDYNTFLSYISPFIFVLWRRVLCALKSSAEPGHAQNGYSLLASLYLPIALSLQGSSSLASLEMIPTLSSIRGIDFLYYPSASYSICAAILFKDRIHRSASPTSVSSHTRTSCIRSYSDPAHVIPWSSDIPAAPIGLSGAIPESSSTVTLARLHAPASHSVCAQLESRAALIMAAAPFPVS
ncbi:hypothetical protein C8J57DRAFT_1722226 [Mycena rebaudengoi]|nr:hypothetical protein C8J57DRAFT_1722226 [Mycena rebaudengoi]